MNTECVFCAIAAGEPSDNIVAQDLHTITLLDLGKRHDGHLLVMPRHHFTDMREMDEATIDAVILAVKRAVHCIDLEYPGGGMRVGSSTSNPSLQGIMHAHFHVYPRHVAQRGADHLVNSDIKPSLAASSTMIERLRLHMLDSHYLANHHAAESPSIDERPTVSATWHARSILWCGCSEHNG